MLKNKYNQILRSARSPEELETNMPQLLKLKSQQNSIILKEENLPKMIKKLFSGEDFILEWETPVPSKKRQATKQVSTNAPNKRDPAPKSPLMDLLPQFSKNPVYRGIKAEIE